VSNREISVPEELWQDFLTTTKRLGKDASEELRKTLYLYISYNTEPPIGTPKDADKTDNEVLSPSEKTSLVAIKQFLKEYKESHFHGTAAELYAVLSSYALKYPCVFPFSNPQTLTRYLNKRLVSLAARGIAFVPARNNRDRRVHLYLQ
jgi:hypothetical protein